VVLSLGLNWKGLTQAAELLALVDFGVDDLAQANFVTH
jgi:hypothetical protein